MPFSSPADGDVSPTIASLLVAGLRRCEGVVAAAVAPVDCRGAAAAKVQHGKAIPFLLLHGDELMIMSSILTAAPP